MSLSLTLGTKYLLKNNNKTDIFLKDINSDNSYLKIDTIGTEYNPISINNFNWKNIFYRFTYLKFEPDQEKIFLSHVKNIQIPNYYAFIVLEDTIQTGKYLFILSGNNATLTSEKIPFLEDLKKYTDKRLGFFNKEYKLVQ